MYFKPSFIGSGEEFQNKFLRWQPWWPSWISNGNYFSYFWSASHLPSFKSIGLSAHEKKFKMVAVAAIVVSKQKYIDYIEK